MLKKKKKKKKKNSYEESEINRRAHKLRIIAYAQYYSIYHNSKKVQHIIAYAQY